MVNRGGLRAVLKAGRKFLAIAVLAVGGAALLRHDVSNVHRPIALSAPINAGSVFAKLPLSFEPNLGQADRSVRFLARGSGYGLFLTSSEAVLSLPSRSNRQATLLQMQFPGAQISDPQSQDRLPGHTHYFLGNDPSRWTRNVPQFAQVRYPELYQGVDLLFYGNQGRLEYDFQVKPGADPNQIQLKFEGARDVKVQSDGSLLLISADHQVRFESPRIYQETNGSRTAVAGGFVLLGDNRVAFRIADYDRRRALTIDPVLDYSTYLGGSGAESCAAAAGASFVPQCPAVAVDSAQRVYVAGVTTSASGWPTPTNPVVAANPGGGADVFVARVSSNGAALVLDELAFVGGSSTDYPTGVAIDSGFNVYLAGNTSSSDFPTINGLQSSASGNHGFVTKLDASTYTPIYSTYLAGSGTETISGMTLDTQARVYVFGTTSSPNFQTTAGALQPTPKATNQFFFVKLDAAQSGSNSLLYSTLFGGSSPANGSVIGGAIAVDPTFHVYIAGGTNFTDMPVVNAYQGGLQGTGTTNVWLAKLNAPTSTTQVYTAAYETYFGAPNDNSQVDVAYGIASDGTNAYLTGRTNSGAFSIPVGTTPFQGTLAGGTDAFVAKFGTPTTVGTTQGTAPLNYFTYLGGSGNDVGLAITADSTQNARVVGFTQSGNFPNLDPLTGSAGGGASDGFFARIATLTSGGSSTSILGGSGGDIATSVTSDASLNNYVVGETSSATDFPHSASTGQPPVTPLQASLSGASDAFLSKLGASTVGLDFACPNGASCPLSNPVLNQTPVGVGNTATFTFSIYNTSDPVTGVIFTASTNGNANITQVVAAGQTCSGSSTTLVCNVGTVNSSSATTTNNVTTFGVAQTVTVTVSPTVPAASGPTPPQPPSVGVSGVLTVAGTNFQRTASGSVVVNDFGVQALPNTQTVTAGNQASYNIIVTPSGPIPESVSLGQCSGLPAGATCSFSNNPIPNLNSGAQSRTLVISTTARVTTPASLFRRTGAFYAFWLPISGLALIGAGVNRKRRWLAGGFVALLLAFVALQSGCSSSSPNTKNTTGTPAGTYTVNLNATCGSATRTTSVTLIVQ